MPLKNGDYDMITHDLPWPLFPRSLVKRCVDPRGTLVRLRGPRFLMQLAVFRPKNRDQTGIVATPGGRSESSGLFCLGARGSRVSEAGLPGPHPAESGQFETMPIPASLEFLRRVPSGTEGPA
jgi:hypothetical protein